MTNVALMLTDCFLVAKDGYLMHEEYYGDAGPETVYESDSMTKVATALLIGVLEQHGLVRLRSTRLAPLSPPLPFPPQESRKHASRRQDCIQLPFQRMSIKEQEPQLPPPPSLFHFHFHLR